MGLDDLDRGRSFACSMEEIRFAELGRGRKAIEVFQSERFQELYHASRAGIRPISEPRRAFLAARWILIIRTLDVEVPESTLVSIDARLNASD